ncbi:LigB family dioxygenase [Andreesenia angusta]|uniref:LigB family dioxygenase n=1 Tax=Andreesenia angusta TaxID=39480 RepID=A0A1S1VAR3_9FIRM|nr:4,5-DOPA dioxygenase extradiol [Andreesenia angusta]OHW63327.1 LigB family dioxygenase [Andreesenia angusta]
MGKMPVVFVGHGSPMNAIEKNEFNAGWREIAESIPRPKAILSISAHWYTKDTKINDEESPRAVYDMYGFPKELYELKYGAKGSPELANRVKNLKDMKVEVDNSWGIDHGTWSVLVHMYPSADIPVVQLSIDMKKDSRSHYELGRILKPLREEGVLIFGSGNIVHDLSKVNWSMQSGYDWAYDFDNYIKESIVAGDHEKVISYESAGDSARLAFKTPEHYYPLLYALGASEKDEKVEVYNDKCLMGSISMTSYVWR